MTLAVDGLQHVSGELAKDFTKSSASGHTIHPPFSKFRSGNRFRYSRFFCPYAYKQVRARFS